MIQPYTVNAKRNYYSLWNTHTHTDSIFQTEKNMPARILVTLDILK